MNTEQRRAATLKRLAQANEAETTPTLPRDLQTPCLISHVTFLGLRQIKRVDSVALGATTHPNVLNTLGIAPDAPLAHLIGDTVDIDGDPVGAVRGWQTYVNADLTVDVIA